VNSNLSLWKRKDLDIGADICSGAGKKENFEGKFDQSFGGNPGKQGAAYQLWGIANVTTKPRVNEGNLPREILRKYTYARV